MVTLVAVETSGALCSLAICAAGRWLEDTQNVERLHNQVVLERLDALVSRAGIERRAIDAVSFGAGPGSFTGVRIAAAVAQGIAFGCGASVVPVSSSLALASAAVSVVPHGPLLTVRRSRRDAYYVAAFELVAGATPQRRHEDRLHQGDVAPEPLPEGGGVGDRPPWWPRSRRFVDDLQVTARVIGELGLEALARGEGLRPEAGLPVYVSGDSPWRPTTRS